jgi:hypothetical protein
MKKTLLFAAALFAATSVFAQEDMEDITPSGYNYDNAEVGLVTIPVGFDEANPPAPYDDLINNYYNNGLFITVGGQMVSGNNYIDILRPGVSIVDLGGQVGKVLCASGYQSKVNDIFKELYEVDLNIPQCTGALNWFNFSWFTDPNNTPDNGTADKPNIRCRIVMNACSNAIGEADDIINKVYMMDKQGNVRSVYDEFQAEKSNVSSAEFALYDSDGEPEEDVEGNYIYDPTRWLVYEFDFHCPPIDLDQHTAYPLRLKMEMNNGNLNHSTIFFKEIKFFKMANNTDPIKLTRRHTYKTMTPDPTVEGIMNTLSGKADNTRLYNLSGAYVGNSTKGLSRGVYVSKSNGKSVKVLVK